MVVTSSRTQAQAAQVEHQVAHQLAGTVVGHLAATIDLHHRDIARCQQVLGLAGLPLGEYPCSSQISSGVVSSRSAVSRRIASRVGRYSANPGDAR